MKRLWLATVLMGAVQADEGVPEVKPTIPMYDNRINFSLGRLGYERLKANDIYVGLQEWFVPLRSKDGNFHWMNEFEGRVGYNFVFEGKDRLTPMVGGGYFRYSSEKTAQTVGYGMAGVAYEHTFNRLFSMGLNLKGTVGSSEGDWGNPILGYQADAPITFRFGRGRHWDYRLAPFFVSMTGQDRGVRIYGAYGEFGYRF